MMVIDYILLGLCVGNALFVGYVFHYARQVGQGAWAMQAISSGDAALAPTCTRADCKNGAAKTCKNGQCMEHCDYFCFNKCR